MAKTLFIAIIFFVASFGLSSEKSIVQGTFKRTVILNAYLKARRAEKLVVPQSTSWQIQLKWMVKEGSYVKSGDPVVRFDTSNLVTEIENLETSLQIKKDEKKQKLNNYKHQLFELETKCKQAEIRYKISQLDANIPRGIESEHDYQKKQLEMKKALQKFTDSKIEQRLRTTSLKTELKTIEIEIEEAKSKLQKYNKILGSLTLNAKTNGTLMYAEHPWQDRKIQVGDNVYTSMTVATIPDMNSLYVDAWVDETDMKILKPGLGVDLQMDAYPQKHYRGMIQDIMKSAEQRNQWGRTRYFNVMIEMKTRDKETMKPGMSTKCSVIVELAENALLVPLTRVVYHNHHFWIKPRGTGLQQIQARGVNHLFLRLVDDSPYGAGTILEAINPEELINHDKN